MDSIPKEVADGAAILARRLNLKRPLAFIDLETTGNKVPSARIVEIAIARLFPDGSTDIISHRVNPGVSIPPEATAIHGITDDDVRNEPEFRKLEASLTTHLRDCDLAGFGIARFDLPVLKAEYQRVSLTFSLGDRAVLDGMAIFFDREPRNLAAAVRFYRGRDLEGAHGAAADAVASMDVLSGQFERYSDLPTDLQGLDSMASPRRREPDWLDEHGFLLWVEGNAYLNFGKYQGVSLSELVNTSPDYVEWMLRGDFPPAIKVILKDAQEGIFPTEP